MAKKRPWSSKPAAVKAVGWLCLVISVSLIIRTFTQFIIEGDLPYTNVVMLLGLIGLLTFTISDNLSYIESRLPPDES